MNGRAIGEELKLNLPPGSTVYQWGEHFEIYFYSGFNPASNLPPIVLQRQNDMFPQGNSFFDFFTSRFRKDISQNRPEVVVTFVNDMIPSPNYNWLLRQYRPFPKALQQPEFTLFARKGSALESQMYPSGTSLPSPQSDKASTPPQARAGQSKGNSAP